ncbi:MAG: hypothetical protein AAF467_17260 [Actinomycetota bacterium]
MNSIEQAQYRAGVEVYSRWLAIEDRLAGVADRVEDGEEGLTGQVVLLVGLAIAGVAAVTAISGWITTETGKLP